MSSWFKKPVILVSAAAAALVLLVLTVLLAISFLKPEAAAWLIPDSSKPTAVIVNPSNQSIVRSGQLVTLAAYVASPSSLGRVDFLVDGEIVQQYMVEPDLQERLVYFPWISSALGLHKLSVIPHDSRGIPGREAALMLGVQSEGAVDRVVFPGEQTGAGAGGDSGPAGDNPGSLDPAAEANEPAGDANDPAAEANGPAGEAEDPGPDDVDQPLPDGEEAGPQPDEGAAVPDEPVDRVPVITFLESSMEIVPGEDGEDTLEVTVIGVAEDDVGLVRLDLAWLRGDEDGDGVQPVAGTSTLCAGQRECTIEVTNPDPAEGLWIYQLTAWDTLGQGVTVFERFEVLGGPAEPPAAAEHDDNGWMTDWLRDFLEAGPLVIDPDSAVSWDDILEPGDILDIVGGSRGEDEGDVVVEEGRCVELRVAAAAQGNRITAKVTCDLEVEEGQILFPYLEKYVSYTAGGGISLFIDDWYDPDRRVIPDGTVFTWLDRDVSCGTSYRYGVRVDTASVSDPSVRAFRSVGVLINVGRAEAVIESESCAQGSISDINLRAHEVPGGVQVQWEVPPGRPWPDDLPDEGVTFTLEHYDVLTRNSWLMFRETVAPDGLLNGHSFQVTHPQTCGNEVWYTVSAVPADADPGLVSPGWLLRQQIRGPEIPCPDQGINSIELSAESFWSEPNRYGVQLGAAIPAGFPWPDGDTVTLFLARQRVSADRCEEGPCLEGGWQVIKSLRITEELRGREFRLDMYDQNVYFFEEYVYALAVGVGAGNEDLSFGPGVSIVTDSSPPRPPRITRLIVGSDSCQAGVNRCVTVEWELYEQPFEGSYYEEAASIALERITGALDARIYPLELDDTRFTDNNPFELEIETVNGGSRRICNYSSTYRLVAYDELGHWYGASPLTVDMLACDVPMDQVVERRR